MANLEELIRVYGNGARAASSLELGQLSDQLTHQRGEKTEADRMRNHREEQTRIMERKRKGGTPERRRTR